jgi:hypothetical protein
MADLGRVIGAVVGAVALVRLAVIALPLLVPRQMHFALHPLHLRLQLRSNRLALRLPLSRI